MLKKFYLIVNMYYLVPAVICVINNFIYCNFTCIVKTVSLLGNRRIPVPKVQRTDAMINEHFKPETECFFFFFILHKFAIDFSTSEYKIALPN